MPKPNSNPKEQKGSQPAQGKTEKIKKQPKIIEESSESEEEEVPKVVPKKQDQKSISKNPPKQTKKVIESEGESSSDEEVPLKRPLPKVQPAKKPVDTKKSKKQVVKEESSEDEEAHIEEDDDYEIGDDDIYIPKKKVKTSKGKEKVIEKETANGANEDAKSEEQKDDIEKYYEKLVKSKADRFSKKQNGNAQRGVLYIGHLPYGFDEEAISKYFQQYGEILNYHLARSKKTSRSMGYAFVEFKYKEVAKAAADSMNGYMLYGKKLECRVLPDSEAVRVKTKKFKFIPFNKKFIEQKNKIRSPQELRKEVKHLLKLEEKRRERLKELGIDYEFPGLKSLVDELKHTKKK